MGGSMADKDQPVETASPETDDTDVAAAGVDDVVAVENEGMLLLLGDDQRIDALLAEWGVDGSSRSGRVDSRMLNTVSGVASTAAQLQESSGRWVKLTKESAASFRKLSKTNKPRNGVLSGVIRGDKGRVAQHAKFSMGDLKINPANLAGLANLAGAFAAQMAAEEIKGLLEGIDSKISSLAEDRRAELVGVTRGVTSVIGEAFELYQTTGALGQSSWEKIQSHQSELVAIVHRGLERLSVQSGKTTAGTTTERARALEELRQDIAPLWIPVLGQAMVSLSRFRILEQARVNAVDPGLAEHHRELATRHHQELVKSIGHTLDSMRGALDETLALRDGALVRHPLLPGRMRADAKHVAELTTELGDYLAWAPALEAEWSHKRWTQAVGSVASAGVDGVRRGAGKTAQVAAQAGGRLTDTARGLPAKLKMSRNSD